MKIENQILVEGNPQIQLFQFRSIQKIRLYIFYFLFVITLGIFYLPFHWFPKLNLLFYNEVQDINKSTHIILFDDVGQIFILEFNRRETIKKPFEQKTHIDYIEFNGINYFYKKEQNKWLNIQKISTKEIVNSLKEGERNIIDQNTAQELQIFYGKNSIEIKVKPFLKCLLEKFFTPLNTYEMFLFYVCILIQSYVFLFLLVFYISIQTFFDIAFYYQRINKINSICHIDSTFKIIRKINNQEQQLEVHSEELVIGDTILVQPQQILTCDVIIIKGSCLIDQAVLTGESIPINKTEIQNNKIEDINKILSGSKCIVLRSEQVKAVVFKTGWNTYKGKLVGKLATQKIKTFKLIKELGKIMLCSLVFYLCLIILQTYLSFQYLSVDWRFNVLIVMELFTSALPASFFFVFSVCSYIIASRLKDKNIYTIINSKIIECGRVKNICFDKTGTLTENKIKIFGFALMNDDILEDPMIQLEDFQLFKQYQQFHLLLACCHSLNVINDLVVGDPIEEEMFKLTKFHLKEIKNQQGNLENIIEPSDYFKKVYKLKEDFNIEIIKELSFTSDRKRMSTIIKSINKNQNNYDIFTKGAPEVMKNYLKPETIPQDYDQKVKEFSEQGFRLLSMAYKTLDDISQDENDLEQQLNFIGFILLDNPLKKESPIIINKLKQNGIKCAMITGDNIYTGINIGIKSNLIEQDQNIWVGQLKKNKIQWTFFNNNELENIQNQNNDNISSSCNSQIIKSRISRGDTFIGNQSIQKVIEDIQQGNSVLTLEGTVFQKLIQFYSSDQQIKQLFLNNTKIYGRANPSEKQLVISSLKEFYDQEDFCVGFVGDGSNDAQALQEANFGLSIGNNDSSLSASFSTKKDNIEPCINIIEEGKMIMENFIQIFKLCTLMGITNAFMILLLSMKGMRIPEILMAFNLIYWSPQFLAMSFSKPRKLNKLYPSISFFEKDYLYSQFIPLIIGLMLIYILYLFLFTRIQFKNVEQIKNDLEDSHYIEPFYFYLLLCVINYSMCLAYNRGYPFKENIQNNKYLMGLGIIVFILVFVFLFNDIFEQYFIGKYINKYLNFADINEEFRIYFIIFTIIWVIIVVLTEKIINATQIIQRFKKAYKKNILLEKISQIYDQQIINLSKLQCKIQQINNNKKKLILICLQILSRKDLEKEEMQSVQKNHHFQTNNFQNRIKKKHLLFNNQIFPQQQNLKLFY